MTATPAQIAAFSRSLRSYRSALTNKLVTYKELLTFAQTEKPTDSLRETIKDAISALKDQYDRTEAAREKCLLYDTSEENQSNYMKKKEEDSKLYEATQYSLTKVLHQIEKDIKKEQDLIAEKKKREEKERREQGQTDQKVKVVDSLKPKILSRDATPVEFAVWRKSFEAFYTASNFRVAKAIEQHAYLYACLDTYLQTKLQSQVQNNTPLFEQRGEDSCMDYLQEEFDLRFPVFARRVDVLRLNQKPGQKFSDFAAELKRRADEAKLTPSLSYDEFITIKYLCGCIDDKLREKFLREQTKTRATFDRIVYQHELGKSYIKAIDNSATVAKVYRNGNGNGDKSHSRDRQGYRYGNKKGQNNSTRTIPTCNNCGDPKPKDGWNHHKCKAKNLSCRKCHKKGHMAQYCKSKAKGKTQKARQVRQETQECQQEDEESDYEWDNESEFEEEVAKIPDQVINSVKMAQVNSNTGNMPYMYIDIIHNRKTVANARTLADTGCTRSVCSAKLLQNTGLKYDPAGKETIHAANGTEISCLGNAMLRLQFQGRKIWINCLVSSELTDDILLSFGDLKKFGIIPHNFPSINYNLVRSTTGDFAQKVQKLVAKYKSVFDTTKVTPIKGPPATIVLDREHPEYRPHHVTTARPIPLHYQAAADKCIKLFLESGVLERVPDQEVNEWQAAGFFVPKPNGDVRLVTDFSQPK